MRKWPFGSILLVAACLLPRAQTSGSEAVAVQPSDFLTKDWSVGPQLSTGRYLGRFKITYYWAVDETEYPEAKSQKLYAADGSLLGWFSTAFVRAFKTEAAAVLRDGRRVSYLKRANRAQVVDKFLGYGGYRLNDLKSVAVDPRVIPVGAKLYIPQAENIVADGVTLNGIFYANDIGSAVKGKHIDIFVGKRQNMAAFVSAGMSSSSSVDVYILE